MRDDEILIGTLLEESWLTVEQIADACEVDPAWLLYRIEAGLFPQVRGTAGTWRLSARALRRVRRMRQLEGDFDAVPELAALVADLIEEVEGLRSRLHGGSAPADER